MSLHLHLLGGSGRIGTAFVEFLQHATPKELSTIWIYCDSTKLMDLEARLTNGSGPKIRAASYSAFSLSPILQEKFDDSRDKHFVFNMRGINNKLCWLNQPLDSLELQIQACRTLVNSDLWMVPGVQIIHLSSLLCDLIERPSSLQDMCEGQESYRRPYMISRLHQEAILSANAFQHGVTTSFVRLPAVYGFPFDSSSPWVLNSLCKQLRQDGRVEPRHPERTVYLTHKIPLVEFLCSFLTNSQSDTVRYLRPPMLQMTVQTLALLVESQHPSGQFAEFEDSKVNLKSDIVLQENDQTRHLEFLKATIRGLLIQ